MLIVFIHCFIHNRTTYHFLSKRSEAYIIRYKFSIFFSSIFGYVIIIFILIYIFIYNYKIANILHIIRAKLHLISVKIYGLNIKISRFNCKFVLIVCWFCIIFFRNIFKLINFYVFFNQKVRKLNIRNIIYTFHGIIRRNQYLKRLMLY